MAGIFHAQTDVERSLVRYTLEGFFDVGDLPAIRAAKDEAHLRLACAPNQHVTLCDVSRCKIQTQDVIGMFGRLIGEPKARARRLAFVTGDSLVRMQLRRLVASEPERIGVFATPILAEHWLLQGGASQAA